MKAKQTISIPIVSVALFGCAAAPAVISDLESDKVIVQSGFGTEDEAIEAKAREGCALHGRVPEAVSFACLDQYCYSKSHLFACITNP